MRSDIMQGRSGHRRGSAVTLCPDEDSRSRANACPSRARSERGGQDPRKLARHLARERGKQVLDPFLYAAFARKGWMVPNQYWTPGVLSPMAIMGKYYMHYDADFLPPR